MWPKTNRSINFHKDIERLKKSSSNILVVLKTMLNSTGLYTMDTKHKYENHILKKC